MVFLGAGVFLLRSMMRPVVFDKARILEDAEALAAFLGVRVWNAT